MNFSFYSCVFLRIEYWEGQNTEMEDLDFFFLFLLLITMVMHPVRPLFRIKILQFVMDYSYQRLVGGL